MKHSLLLGKILNQPLLVAPAYLNTVCGVLTQRGAGLNLPSGLETYEQSTKPHKVLEKLVKSSSASGYSLVSIDHDLDDENNNDHEMDEPSMGIAVVPILGALAQRGGNLNADSSVMRGYNDIKNDIYTSLQREDVGGVALHIDSPGGALNGCFGLCDFIAEASKDFDKPVWALVDENAYSAAYAIASSADRIITTHSGGAGSIGVVTTHVNVEKMMSKKGVEVTYIYAGSKKVEGNPYSELSDAALKNIQSDINYHYEDFVKLVANNRGISEQSVRETQADTFVAEVALEKNLIDSVQTMDSAFLEFLEHVNGSETQEPIAINENLTIGTDMKTKVTGQAPEADKTALKDRCRSIMGHAAATANHEVALNLALDESVSLETATSILDALGDKDKLIAESSPAPTGEPAPGASGEPQGGLPLVLQQGKETSAVASNILAAVLKAGNDNPDVQAFLDNGKNTQGIGGSSAGKPADKEADLIAEINGQFTTFSGEAANTGA